MLVKKDPDLISSYLQDHSNLAGGFCDSVFFPEDEKDVSDVLMSASRDGIPVTISAAGTGVTGGRIPFGGHVLSMEKMNRIEDIRGLPSGDGFAVVEPGVILKDMLEKVGEKGLFYPPGPTEKSSFIGGNIATSASGARSFKYGTTRDYVLALRVVLSSGDILDIKRGQARAAGDGAINLPLVSGEVLTFHLPGYVMPDIKSAAGYYIKEGMDAIDLFIGQEGTLGVITKIKLKLLKSPGSLIDCYAFFREQSQALDFVDKVKALCAKNRVVYARNPNGIGAVSLEFFDKNALSLLRQRHGNIPKEAEAAVYFEQETDAESEARLIDGWSRLIINSGGSLDETWFAQTEAERGHLQDIRHDLPDMVNNIIRRQRQPKVGTDLAVPHNRLREMVSFYNKTLLKSRMRYLIFGHIGDSHLHVNILPEDAGQHERAKALYELLAKKAVSLGGTVSAEHGIGKLKHSFLEIMYGRKTVREMAQLKKKIDAPCILGRGNIFLNEFLS